MKRWIHLFAGIILAAISAFSEGKGNCPPPPPASLSNKGTGASGTTQDKSPPGRVTLLLVVSDTGYLSSARVLRGVDKKTDANVLDALRKWRFTPAQKDGRAVPVTMTVTVTYRSDKDRKLIPTDVTPQEGGTPEPPPQ